MTENTRVTSEPIWLTQYLAERCAAIADLADSIEMSQNNPLDQVCKKARIYLTKDSDVGATERCLVCGIPLCGNQREFCWGHWDFIVVRSSDTLELSSSGEAQVVDELRTLTGLKVRHIRPYYIGIAKGKCRCSVCNDLMGISERIIDASGGLVKWHYVCMDHMTFRGNPIINGWK